MSYDNIDDIIKNVKDNPYIMNELLDTNPELANKVIEKMNEEEQLKPNEMNSNEMNNNEINSNEMNSNEMNNNEINSNENITINTNMNNMNSNDMDIEYQKKLEAEIQEKNILENYAKALEYNPESFASVYMLYINCVINDTEMKAFIDSGAQATIMSKECAEKCNLIRLMDTKFSGMAYGVGTAKILGRIHLVPMKIGNEYYN